MAIIRGHNDKMMFGHRTAWETARWQTCNILKVLGCKGIEKTSDLVEFPWEEEARRKEMEANLPSDDEVERMRRELTEMNERMVKAR